MTTSHSAGGKMQDIPVDDARLMTFAGIAYGAVGKIPDYVQAATLLSKAWSVIWTPGPEAGPDNLAFLAINKAEGVAVLAIRGTYPNPFSPIYWENGQQDSPFGPMILWPGSRTARISKGTHTGFSNLCALQDANGQTIAAAVQALDPSISLCVTGHSLGGTLTPVMALMLADADRDRDIYAVSFAGLTPGNRAFAALFGSGSRLQGRTRRVYNTLDSVSYGWNNVLATRNFFAPAPKGGLLVKLFLVVAWLRLCVGRYGYAPIGRTVPLKGAVRDPTQKSTLVNFVIETLHQHMPDTYLSLLGAPPLPFSILFGTVIGGDAGPAKPSPSQTGVPVFHITP